VLALTVRSNTQQVFSELHIDTEGFSKVYDDASFTYYASRALGIEYVVSREGFLNSVTYFPLVGDLGLRCKCFPLEDGSDFRGETWDSFEGVSRDSLLGRLDNYAIQL